MQHVCDCEESIGLCTKDKRSSMAIVNAGQGGRLTTENGPVSRGLAARRMLRMNALLAGEAKSSRPTEARTPPIATAPPPTKAALTDTAARLRGALIDDHGAFDAAANPISQGTATERPAPCSLTESSSCRKIAML